MHQRSFSMGGVLHARLAIALACAVLIVAGWAITLERIHYERENAIEETVRQNTNLAIAFEEQTLRAIRAADQALIFLRRQYQEHGEIADLRELFDVGVLDNALIPNYLVVDSRGRVLRKDGSVGPLDVSDRDFFEYHRSHAAPGLFISRPFTGRMTGKTVISLSRRITSADGSFAGVVSVGLDAVYFLNTYKSLDLGPRGLIQLVGLDGVARVRRIGDEASFGQDMSDSALLARAAAAPTGSFVSAGTWSAGVRRHQSYRVLRDYPLVIAVGTAEDDALAEFSSRERHYYAGAGIATALMLLFTAGLLIAQARRDRAEAENRAMESRYRATFDQAAIGIAHTGLDGRFLAVNAKCCAMLGYSREELLERRVADVTHPEDLERSSALRKRVTESGGTDAPAEIEKRYVCKDGSVLWALISVAAVRAERGAPLYFVTMIRDITARRQAEAQLIEQLDELRRFQKVTVDRELRMVELEAEIRALKERVRA